MTLILAADTSTRVNSVALCRMNAAPHAAVSILAETVLDGEKMHAGRLISAAEWTLREAGAALNDVGLLAVSIGPGSFTGLRIGVAAWKGLALARRLPLAGAPTLDAMTRLALCDGIVCPCLDAKMREVFVSVYRITNGARELLLPPRACAPRALADALAEAGIDGDSPIHLFGDGAVLYADEFRASLPNANIAAGATLFPRAAAVAEEGARLWSAGAPCDGAFVEPVYARASQAEVLRDIRLRSAAP